MLAIKFSEYELYGCPNCGCSSAIRDHAYISNQPTGKCSSCGLCFQILADGLQESSIKFQTGRRNEYGVEVFESPILIPHPRKGIPKWNWENSDAQDVRPSNGEFWKPRGIGYDLSGFVKSKKAGERILEMVKEILDTETPKSWLDYRPSEPNWIQFKFDKSEFDLEKLYDMVTENDNIITREIIITCKK